MHTYSLTLTHDTLHRYARAGHTPALEVTVTYPVLALADAAGRDCPEASAVERFNQAYRTMAEAFLTWSDGAPAEMALAAFAAAGLRAVYTFDRRCLSCRMEAEMGETYLTVRRKVTRGSRRGSVPPFGQEDRDVWRLSDLSLT